MFYLRVCPEQRNINPGRHTGLPYAGWRGRIYFLKTLSTGETKFLYANPAPGMGNQVWAAGNRLDVGDRRSP